MFDFGWSEIALIAGVALVLIGPKDLPVAIRAITEMIKKARRMASEFQTHVDEMVREANLDEVRNSISEIRNFDFKGELERKIDPDGSLRSTFSDPLTPTPSSDAIEAPAADAAVAELEPIPLTPPEPPPDPAFAAAPAFVPPGFVTPTTAAAADGEAPAFIPPQVVLQSRPRASA